MKEVLISRGMSASGRPVTLRCEVTLAEAHAEGVDAYIEMARGAYGPGVTWETEIVRETIPGEPKQP